MEICSFHRANKLIDNEKVLLKVRSYCAKELAIADAKALFWKLNREGDLSLCTTLNNIPAILFLNDNALLNMKLTLFHGFIEGLSCGKGTKQL